MPYADLVRRRANNRATIDRLRTRNREWLDAIKLERGCVDCGYRAHSVALDFDHVDGKSAGVSRMMRDGATRARLEVEVARCEVVCANCHRVRTRARGQHGASRRGVA